MTKIAFVGGGSSKFVRGTVVDLLAFPALHDCKLMLMDLDQERLDRTEKVVQRIVREKNVPMRVSTTTDQRRAVAGADFVVVTVMVGGMKSYEADTFIPDRHGVHQAVGDTIGPGAVMRLLRTYPVLRELVANVRELAPEAWILSYVNPMAMVTQALLELGHQRTVGLCHAIPSMVRGIADWLGVPHEEIAFEAAGINHLAFFLKMRHGTRDLLAELRERSEELGRDAETWEAETWKREKRGYERVRMELLRYLGYFPAEGPWHQGEYYPWFRKTQALVDHYGPPTGWAYRFDTKLAEGFGGEVDKIVSGESPVDYTASHEAAVPAMNAIVTNAPHRFYGNLMNTGLITNLSARAVVEVPCLADGMGI
jgi:alpha-galactosidase